MVAGWYPRVGFLVEKDSSGCFVCFSILEARLQKGGWSDGCFPGREQD